MAKNTHKNNFFANFLSKSLVYLIVTVPLLFSPSLVQSESQTYVFTSSDDYTIDDGAEFSAAEGTIGTYTHNDNGASEFGGNTQSNISWDADNSYLELENETNGAEFPDNESKSWVDMTDNTLLIHFNEESYDGTTDELVDSSGNENHGTANASFSNTNSGKFNNSASLSGTQYFTGFNSNALPTNNGTIILWFKQQSSSSAYRYAFSHHDDSDASHRINIYTRYSTVYARMGDTLITAGNQNFAEFNFIACKYSTTEVKCRLNDNDWVTGNALTEVISLNADTIAVGRQVNESLTASYQFTGEIDELAIWGRTLSDSEIDRIYNIQNKTYTGITSSAIYDATDTDTAWTGLKWKTNFPVGKALPNNGESESDYNNGVDMSDIVTLYHLDESSGSTAYDSSGEGHDCSLSNITYNSDGKFGGSQTFNGSNSYINCGDHDNFTFSDGITSTNDESFSICSWVRRDDLSEQIFIVSKNPSGGTLGEYSFHINSSNTVIARVIDSSNGAYMYRSGSDFAAQEWHHACMTYDGSKNVSGINIYIDGELANSSTSSSGTYEAMRNTNYDLVIGNRDSNYDSAMDGEIDEVAIWNRELSSSEIQNLAARGHANVQFLARSCDDSNCSGDDFTNNFLTENNNRTASLPEFETSLSNNRYHQYLAILSCEESIDLCPKLEEVTTSTSFDGSKVQLKNRTNDQTDDDNTSTGFDGGTHSDTEWDSENSVLSNSGIVEGTNFPDNGAADGWFDMSNNTLLLHFDESEGSTSLSDSSGNSHTVSSNSSNYPDIVSSPTKIGNAADFTSGNNDNIQVADDDAFSINTTGELSASFWVKTGDDVSTFQTLLSKGSQTDGNHEWRIFINSGYIYANHSASNGNGNRSERTSSTISTDTWYHVVVNFTGTTHNDDTEIYINGSEVSSVVTASTTYGYSNTSEALAIGRSYASHTLRKLTATIDEVALFSNQLSSGDVNTIYTTQVGGVTPNFISRIMDAGETSTWTSLTWAPSHPYGAALANDGVNESTYDSGNVDMTNNTLLLHFDESGYTNGSTGDVTDSSGNDYDGTPYGDTTTTDGLFNKAVTFDGSGDYIKGFDSSALPSSGTIVLWFKSGSTSGYDYMFSHYNDSSSSEQLYIYLYNGDLCFKAGSSTQECKVSDVADNQWHMVALSYGTSTWKYSYDGENWSNLTSSDDNFTVQASNIGVGAIVYNNGGTMSNYFDGELDDLAIFSDELSNSELSTIYNRSIQGIKFQVRTCDDSACSGEDFVGPDGTSSTYYDRQCYTGSNASPTINLSNVDCDGDGSADDGDSTAQANNRYAQYKLYFEESDATVSSVTLGGGGSGYATSPQTVINDTNKIAFDSLDSISLSSSGNVKLQITNDGESYYYYDTGEATWTEVSGAVEDEANDPDEISDYLSTFDDDVGTGNFQFRALMSSSDGTTTSSMSSMTINYAATSLENLAPSAPTSLYSNDTSSGAQSGSSNPTSLADLTPEFSAVYNDDNTGDIANKYCIQVNTSSSFDGTNMWYSDNDSCNTGTSISNIAEGNRMSDIEYDDANNDGSADSVASALSYNTTYYWRIKFWDDEPSAGTWSSAASFKVSQGSATVTSYSSLSDVSVSPGSTPEVIRFKVSAAAEDITVNSLTINVGAGASTAYTDLEYARVYRDTGGNGSANTLLLSQGTITADSNILTLTTPLTISAGSDDYIQIYLKNKSSTKARQSYTPELTGIGVSTDNGATPTTTISSYTSRTITISDPTVTLAVNDSSIYENDPAETATFTVSASHASLVDIAVTLSISGSATTDSDYSHSSTSLTITAGDTTDTMTVTSIDDSIDESTNESVQVEIDSVTNASETSPNSATTYIYDNDDPPTVSLSVGDNNPNENDGTVSYTATLSEVSGRSVIVYFSFSGTATLNTDYSRSDSSIIIAAGDLSNSGTITLTDDSLDEDNETIIIDISSVTRGTENETQQETITVNDNDDAPTVSLSISGGSSIDENVDSSSFVATLSAASGKDVTVELSLSGTATVDTDYSASTTSITIPAGSTARSSLITSIDDEIYEGNETVIADISSVTNATENGTQQQTMTITEDDLVPDVTLSVNNSTIAENGGVATLTASMNRTSVVDVTITLTYTGDAQLVNDVTASSQTITISAGETSGTATLTAVSDSLDEDNETITAAITGVVNAAEDGDQSQTVTITDDDDAPTVTLSVDDTSLAETEEVATLTATLSTVSGKDITVNLLSSGTASSDSDYSLSSTSITISAGDTTGTATLTSIDDTADEEDTETATIDISSVTNATESGTQSVSISISDNDDPPTVSLSVDDDSIAEDSGEAVVTATLSAASGKEITVTLALAGDATETDDYTIDTTEITIDAGSETGTATVTGVDDNSIEDGESVIVSIDSVTNASEDGDQEVTITLNDDEPNIVVTESASATSVTEGDTTDTVAIRLATEPTDDVTITLSLENDEVSLDENTLTFTSDNYSSNQTVTITAVDDDFDESNHSDTLSFVVSSNDTGYDEFEVSDITVNIVDNDSAGVSLSQSGGVTVIGEDGTTDSFTVVLTSEPTSDVTISITVDAQVSVSSSSLTFTSENWDSAQSVTVSAVDDDSVEASSHNGVIRFASSSEDSNFNELGISSITASVTDDDSAAITITESDEASNVDEASEDADTFTVVLGSEPSSNVTITITTDDDVEVDSETLTFTTENWESAQTVSITSVDDDIAEGNHSSTISFASTSSDDNYHAQEITSITVSITDNDTSGISLANQSSLAITENESDSYTIVLDSEPTENVVITLSVASVVSLSPESLTFTPENWDSAQTITISLGSRPDQLETTRQITHSVRSNDSNYNSVSLDNLTVSITVEEEESEEDSGDTGSGGIEKEIEEETVSCNSKQCIEGDQYCNISTSLCSNFQLGSNCSYSWEQRRGKSVELEAISDISLRFKLGTGHSRSLLLRMTETCNEISKNYNFEVKPIRRRVSSGTVSSNRIENKVVAAAPDGKRITEETFTDNTGQRRKALNMGEDTQILSSTEEDVEIEYLPGSNGQRILLADPSFNNERGIIASVDLSQVIGRIDEIDITDPDISLVEGIITLEGPKIGARLGHKIANVSFDGTNYIAALIPGNNNGSVYIIDIENLEIQHIIHGYEAEAIHSEILVSVDMNGDNYSDPIVGITSGNGNSLSRGLSDDINTAESITIASETSSFNGILADNNLPSVLNLENDTDITIDIPGGIEVSKAVQGNINGDSYNDIVLCSADSCNCYVYNGKSSPDSELQPDQTLSCDESEGVSDMAIGDFTGDGLDDIAMVFEGSNTIYILIGGDEVSFESAIIIEGGDDDFSNCLVVGDYDSDGIVDLYACTIDGDSLVININDTAIVDDDEGNTSNAASSGGGGGGCSLNQSNHHQSLLWMTLMLFAFLLIVKGYNSRHDRS